MAPATGARERLLRHGPEVLEDAELLALLLRTGRRGHSALDLAGSLLAALGFEGLGNASADELQGVGGIGAAKAASLLAAIELGRRSHEHRLERGDPLRGPGDVARHFRARLRGAPTERFHVLMLDGRHRVLRAVLASHGTLTASLVHPREVFRAAIRESAAALILVHNHPSGDPEPSPEDVEVTRRLGRAGELVGIPVLDHVIVADRGFVSLREEGIFDPPRGSGSGGGGSHPKGPELAAQDRQRPTAPKAVKPGAIRDDGTSG
jgi:DNA repair protein RadC